MGQAAVSASEESSDALGSPFNICKTLEKSFYESQFPYLKSPINLPFLPISQSCSEDKLKKKVFVLFCFALLFFFLLKNRK